MLGLTILLLGEKTRSWALTLPVMSVWDSESAVFRWKSELVSIGFGVVVAAVCDSALSGPAVFVELGGAGSCGGGGGGGDAARRECLKVPDPDSQELNESG